MLVEQLQPGRHVSVAEFAFACRTTGIIRRAGYSQLEPIEVVGSRLTFARVSRARFAQYCAEFQPWYAPLNQIALERDLSAGEIRELLNYLPKGVPIPVIRFLEKAPEPGADLDLLLRHRPPGVKKIYDDTDPPIGSGMDIDTFIPGQYEEDFKSMTLGFERLMQSFAIRRPWRRKKTSI
jgi:hypothetical protein